MTAIVGYSDAAAALIIDMVLRDNSPLTLVDSPPGAGKTTLVEHVAAASVIYAGLRVAIVAPRAEQTYDILRRLTQHFPMLPIQVFQSASRNLPPDLDANPLVPPPIVKAADLVPGAGVVVGTASKFQFSTPQFRQREFDVLICDEAYQVQYGELAPLLAIASQVLLVGDPGQLPPVVTVDIRPFEAAATRVHRPAPQEIMRRFPDLQVIQLPNTKRFPADTVEVLQPSLYPGLAFTSAVVPWDARLAFSISGLASGVDRALDKIAAGASIVGIILPERRTIADEVDEDVSQTCAELANRILERGAYRPGLGAIDPEDIGIVDAHVASGAATQRHLRRSMLSTDEIMVTTPEIWQGSERAIMIAKHPLSGVRRLQQFHLEPGRYCVMLSRHKLACILVGRTGISDALEDYQHDASVRAMSSEVDAAWQGWVAHQRIWQWLEANDRLIEL